ncbi:MAG: hypothetical protein JST47_03705 [Bacteroidetes bacterium]|nr:hypothetical protein [Bacteroidota bacterium]
MKKTFSTAVCFAALLSLSAFSVKADVNKKVLKSFHSVFSRATNVQWEEYKDHYFVSFKQNDMLVKANYDMNGNMVNSIRYYKAQYLPLNILYAIKENYPSKTINIVTEVNDDNGTNYFIELKDNRNWTIIQSDADANFNVFDKFKKA